MRQYIRIKKWDDFQHYKDRKVIWIKFYVELLDNNDPYDTAYTDLSDTEKCHLHHLWLLAGKCDNKIPYVKDWISSKLNIKSPLKMDKLIASGFIELVNDDGSIEDAPKIPPRKSKEKAPVLTRSRCTAEEAKDYATSIGFVKFDGQNFTDYYSSQNWKKGNGQPLADWKSAVRQWFKKEYVKESDRVEQLKKVYNTAVLLHGQLLYAQKQSGVDIDGELNALKDKYRDYKKYKGKTVQEWVIYWIAKQEKEDVDVQAVRREVKAAANKLKQTREGNDNG